MTPNSKEPKYSLPEIERRWFVDLAMVGPLDELPYRTITDRYINGTGLRLRKVEGANGNLYKLAKKAEGRITNIYLTESEHHVLSALPATVLKKTRFAVESGSLDVPEGDLPPRWESEFDSEEDARRFIPPTFVTHEDLSH